MGGGGARARVGPGYGVRLGLDIILGMIGQGFGHMG